MPAFIRGLSHFGREPELSLGRAVCTVFWSEQEIQRTSHDVGFAEARDPHCTRVPAENLARHIQHDDRKVVRAINEQPKSFFTFAQRSGGGSPVSDFDKSCDRRDGLAPDTIQGRRTHHQRPTAAVTVYIL